jgi:hypothetical protein
LPNSKDLLEALSKLRRYYPAPTRFLGQPDVSMAPDDSGSWLKEDDVRTMLKAFQEPSTPPTAETLQALIEKLPKYAPNSWGQMVLNAGWGPRYEYVRVDELEAALAAEPSVPPGQERISQCERCGGTGFQSDGLWNFATQAYDSPAGVCADCWGAGKVRVAPSVPGGEALHCVVCGKRAMNGIGLRSGELRLCDDCYDELRIGRSTDGR